MEIKVESTDDFKALARLNQTVQTLHNQLYPEEFKPFNLLDVEKAFSRLLSTPGSYAFLAKEGEQGVGYMLCFVKTRNENEFQFAKTMLYIDQLSVEKTYRNKGIAKRLLNKAIGLAEDLEIAEIQLDHWGENTEARKFFEAHGFMCFKHKMKKLK